MILDDETVGGHLSASENPALTSTEDLAVRLGVSRYRLRRLLIGRTPAATRYRGGGAPPERLWAPSIVEDLAIFLPKERSE